MIGHAWEWGRSKQRGVQGTGRSVPEDARGRRNCGGGGMGDDDRRSRQKAARSREDF